MNTSDPVAFLSYVRADDEHERGRITALRARLEGEVRMQTGKPFSIFQDRKDISWGQQWRERLDTELFNVTFLIPVITPGFFTSAFCRDEVEKFQVRERQLGKNTLILPIYYLAADEMFQSSSDQDSIATILSQRNYADWRKLRFKELNSPEIDEQIAMLAQTIKRNMQEIQSEITAAKEEPKAEVESIPTPVIRDETPTGYSPEIPTLRGRIASRPATSYYAYTKEFDEVIDASSLIDRDSWKELVSLVDSAERKIRRSRSNLISNAISAATTRFGELQPSLKPDVIFLIDNSGSFRDQYRMHFIAGWLRIIVQSLEQNGINSEILGFTTRAWKGGSSREAWLADGKPTNPGRLNDLRHIVYKGFEQPIDDCIASLGLMASGRLLKENIDGEGLLWAYRRAQFEAPMTHSIIVMITDGAPVDDSTLLENTPGFLAKHLQATVAWVGQQSDVSIYGVGIDHDTSAYFPRGIPMISARASGLAILEALPHWIKNAEIGH